MKTRISGKEAMRVAEDMAKPGPIRVVAASDAQEAKLPSGQQHATVLLANVFTCTGRYRPTRIIRAMPRA